MQNPLVSIIINCFNGEKYLSKCINSIIKQTYKNWEIIFWDNCSSDKSRQIVKNYNERRIKIFSSKKFMKLYEARNEAIKKSKGKYVCFLDTDDFWEIEKIKDQVNFLEKNSNFQMVYSNYYTHNENKKKIYVQNNYNLPSGRITSELLKNYTIGILTVCIRRSIFDKNLFNKDYEIIGDFDFFLSLSTKINIGCIQKKLANYRIHGNNYSKKKIDLYIKELKKWINDNKNNYLTNNYGLINQKILLYKLKLKKYLNFFI